MTRVYGFALNPNNGTALAGRTVYASLIPDDVLPPPTGPVTDETVTATDGRWELNLQPTTSVQNVHYRIRVWQLATFWVNVPEPPVGDTAISIDTILIPPPAPPDPPPQAPGAYVMRSELEQPGGVATLGTDGWLKTAQRPPGVGSPDVAEWFSGDGPPGVVPGASLGDLYVDQLTGDLYYLS